MRLVLISPKIACFSIFKYLNLLIHGTFITWYMYPCFYLFNFVLHKIITFHIKWMHKIDKIQYILMARQTVLSTQWAGGAKDWKPATFVCIRRQRILACTDHQVELTILITRSLGQLLNRFKYEPQHNKTYKMTRASSEDSDQPGWISLSIRPLWSELNG